MSSAILKTIYDFPGSVLLLGETGDPRSILLLRRALRSHNYFIVIQAAKGLAKLQDRDSIPLILTALQGAPPECTVEIAKSLVYFDDARAQGAVDSYIPKEMATQAREARAKGMGVFGW